MKIDILSSYRKNQTRSEFYYGETIIVAEKGNIRLDIFCEGDLTCRLSENKSDLKRFNDSGNWTKFKGGQVTQILIEQDYTDSEVCELSINDMFTDQNWFAWTITDIEKNEIISDENDILDTADDCLNILNKFIKGELNYQKYASRVIQ